MHTFDLAKVMLKHKEVQQRNENNPMSVLWLTFSQIAEIDLLTKLGLQPDGIIGHSVGELACGYADGSLSHSEAVLAAYWRGICIKEANLPPGGMAAVGKREQ